MVAARLVVPRYEGFLVLPIISKKRKHPQGYSAGVDKDPF
jgi:hypothetical protein